MSRSNLNLRSLLVLSVVLAFTSCSRYKLLTIESMRPPKEGVPDHIQSLTLMNRSLTNEYHNFDEKKLQQYFYEKGFNGTTYVLDSMAADTCVKALSEILYESGRFDIVVPVARNLPKNSHYYVVEEPLDWDSVTNICNTYNTDGLLVMERMLTRVSTSFMAQELMDGPHPGTGTKFYGASMDDAYDAFFRLYDPKTKTIASTYYIADTIFWDNQNESQTKLFAGLPTIKKGLYEAAINVALDLDSRISPSWKQETRGYFTIKPDDASEKQLIASKDWVKTAEYWSKFTASKSKNIRSKAEFNMGLSSELNGDLDGAIEWLTKSFKTMYRNQTEVYLKRLQSRKALFAKYTASQKGNSGAGQVDEMPAPPTK